MANPSTPSTPSTPSGSGQPMSSLPWMRILFARELRSLAREIELFPDDESLWRVLPGITNSAGNLALHLSGNLQHFVGAVLGDSGYVRDREREFAATELPRAEVQREIGQALRTVDEVLARLTGDDLVADYPVEVAGVRMATGLFLLHLGHHLAFHVGQVGYLRRILTGDGQVSGALGLRELATAP